MMNDLLEKRFYLAATLLGLGILIVLITVSLAQSGLPSGHDLASHIFRSKLFIAALQQGQFPVRWVEWMTPGNGLPLFNFYQDGFYYLVAAVYTLTHSLEITIKLILAMGWFLAAFFTFLLTKRFGTFAALAAAFTYVLTPYCILDIFVRAAYPEFIVLCLLPGLLWSLEKVILLRKWNYGVAVVLFVGLMICTHIPSVIIFSPVIISFCLLWLRQVENKKFLLLAVILAGLLGISLSAFFLLPALKELALVQYHILMSDNYDFHQHFVYFHQLFNLSWGYGYSVPGDKDDMSFQLGMIPLSLVVLGMYSLVFRRKKLAVFERQQIFLCVGLLCYAVFFMLSCSMLVWEHLKFIQIIQYPWRFLMVIPILSAMLAASLFHQVTHSEWKFYCAAALIMLSCVVVSNYLRPAQFLPSSYFVGIKMMPTHEYGFFPVNSLAKLTQVSDRISASQHTKIQYLVKRDTEIQARITTAHATFITFNERYFPGWKVYLDGRAVKENHQNTFGFMQISVPKGEHQVLARFENTWIRSVANWISLLTLMSLFFLGIGMLVI